MHATVGRLRLVNFRSYPDATFTFGNRTVVVGRNAAGKTNLLESIYLLSATKSFRADREREMVRWGETGARVEAAVRKGDDAHTIVCQLQVGERTLRKTFQVDGTKRKATELAREFPAALFAGDDLRMIDGSPGRRRRVLDLVIGQGSVGYLLALRRYGRVLASRNRLLERIAAGESGTGELDFWDDELVTQGQVLIDGRKAFFAAANERLPDAYGAIAGASGRRLQLDYRPLSESLRADIPRRRDQDVAVGTTTAGPHRDDWSVLLGNRPLVSFGSGGEFRSAVLAFRMAEADWLQERLGVTPVFLLDDVFSELDNRRQAALLDNLPAGQTIITTPQAETLPREFTDQATVLAIGATDHV